MNAIGHNRRQGPASNRCPLFFDRNGKVPERLIYSDVRVDWLAHKSIAPNPGKRQQIFEQRLHASCALDGIADVAVRGVVELPAVTFREQLGICGDHSQRLLQIMRGDISELLEIAIRTCQFLDLLRQLFLRPRSLLSKPRLLKRTSNASRQACEMVL